MFVSRRKYDELEANYQRVLDQRDAARREARTALAATRTAAGHFTSTDTILNRVRLARIRDAVKYGQRIERLARAVCRYRVALTAETRRADRLQAAYDNATSLSNPALEHGAAWQTRRSDKAQTAVAS